MKAVANNDDVWRINQTIKTSAKFTKKITTLNWLIKVGEILGKINLCIGGDGHEVTLKWSLLIRVISKSTCYWVERRLSGNFLDAIVFVSVKYFVSHRLPYISRVARFVVTFFEVILRSHCAVSRLVFCLATRLQYLDSEPIKVFLNFPQFLR